ncbi:MAG: HAD-IA family hydrolase, partial [Lachnospiraceae bacterium]|nr:HAD-IA family hydrolase [Lachnospiraceae bacterium]
GLYILSNVSLRMAVNDRWREYVPYPDDFDGVFLSAEYKMLKPQPIIYETFCNRYGLKAEDCLFIDDLKRNIDAAKACGMGGIVFDGDAEKLRKDLLGTDDRK